MFIEKTSSISAIESKNAPAKPISIPKILVLDGRDLKKQIPSKSVNNGVNEFNIPTKELAK